MRIRSRHKLFACIVTVILATLALPLPAMAAEPLVDIPPTIRSIWIEKTTVNAGETIKVSVDADIGSGREAGGMVMWGSSSVNAMGAYLEYNPTTGKLEGELEVDTFAEPGLWRCVELSVYGEGGFADAGESVNLRTADFTVINENPDIDPPTISSLSISPKTVDTGDEVIAVVTATDDRSGVSGGSIDMICEANDGWISIWLEVNEETGVLEGTGFIDDMSPPGTYKIENIVVYDNAGNEKTISRAGKKLPGNIPDVTVVVKGEDTTPAIPPVILSPTSGSAGELKIVDASPKRAGFQFEVEGYAMPSHTVKLYCDGKVVAEPEVDYAGYWSATVTAAKAPVELSAIATSPNGDSSGAWEPLTRAKAARMLVSIYGITAIGRVQIGLFKDVYPATQYAKQIQAAVDAGLMEGDGDYFRPDDLITRADFVKGIYGTVFFFDEEEDEEPFAYNGYFSDVPESSPYAEAIESAYDYGMFKGNPNGTFRPDDFVRATTRISGIPSISYTDLTISDWSIGYVYDLSMSGIVSGYANGTFKPDNPVTRAEFMKMLCKKKGWELGSQETTACADLTESHWAYPYVMTLKERGIIDGYAGNYIYPDQVITRAEAVKIVVAAEGLTLNTASPKFADVIDHWARDYILTARDYKLVSGYPDGSFCPDATLSRSESSKLTWLLAQP